MDKGRTKKALEVQRISFLRVFDVLKNIFKKPTANRTEVGSTIALLEQKYELILELDRQFFNQLLEDDTSSEDLNTEMIIADDYASKYYESKSMVESFLQREITDNNSQSSQRHTLKLPKIELIKFNGDIKDWLTFWGQFKRIDVDEVLDNEDKYQYLRQSTLENSRARQIVDSFPGTSENYPKVIDALKNRFGRNDLLIEYYVRELLKLVLLNVTTQSSLSSLYDKIETQLRNLETLDIKTDTCAAMLYPLVESCLSEELLRIWQRSSQYDESTSLKSRLERLMNFMKKEVESEEKIVMATNGFELRTLRQKQSEEKNVIKPPHTASDLINSSKIIKKCVFCNGLHLSVNCFGAKKMTLIERKQKLNEKGCCHLCLKIGHIAKKCRNSSNLFCSRCSGKHFFLMCPKTDEDKSNLEFSRATINPTPTIENTLSNNTYGEVFLQTLKVKLLNNFKSRYARVILDTGSKRSYITQAAATEMNYEPIRQEQLVHALFGGSVTQVIDHNCYEIHLNSLNNSYACNFEALGQPMICQNVSCVQEGPWLDELKALNITITDTHDGHIDILIGADICGKLFTGNRHVLSSGLVAMETLLGWILMGKISANSFTPDTMMPVPSLFNRDLTLSDLWRLDAIGINDPMDIETKRLNAEDIMNHFLSTVTRREDGRYEVSMPWIEGHPPLPSNYDIARARLKKLSKKLMDDGYFEKYNEVFQDWVKEGIIEPVLEEDIETDGHYLPHRHVLKLSSETTKIRPVFDASAKQKGSPSLNECLIKGINFLELIPNLLIKFRLNKYGVISDIKKAFLQIGLINSDRNFLKFLWYENDHLKTYRHARVVFGATCSPFILNAVIIFHLQTTLELIESGNSIWSSSVISKLLESFYVDNCVTSVCTTTELQNFIKEASDVFSEAQMELRGWEHTNCDEYSFGTTHLTSVLGLCWNRNIDTLELNLGWLTEVFPNSVTKRHILSTAQRLFDPIGFICPTALCPKLLLQKTWLSKIGWDVEVEEDIKYNYLKWLKELPLLINLKIPRWILTSHEAFNWSVHVFCDASKHAYATAIFLRTETHQGVNTQLLIAKSRLSPVKKITIPRLELLAACIGGRLSKIVRDNIKSNLKFYWWTDSTTVLSWIKREDSWKQYVWNRVNEIRRLTDVQSWFYVPGDINPADLPSRGCSPKHLIQSKWWEGPSWLKKSPDYWPVQCYDCNDEVINEEKKKNTVSSLFCSLDDYSWYHQRISKFSKIVRVLGWLKRFLNNCRKRNLKKKGILSLDEIISAEKNILQYIQEESFKGDVTNFKNICPFKDNDNLFKVLTKVSNRNDVSEYCHPVLLPSKHPVVKKLIYEEHIKHFHVGVQGLLSILRERFWIVNGRTVRSVVLKCTRCRRFNSRRTEVEPTALPEERVRDALIFEITGVDLAGPLFIRSGEKVWICLFTCAIYRAIHMELVLSLSTADFLQALRRFIARRGRPSIIYSDNGTNFVGCDNLFSKLDWSDIETYSVVQRIKWKFIPATGAWWGGWWERLIKIVKDLLRKVLGKASLTYQELTTILCECEGVVNARPLTYISEDCQDLKPLTPAMFLQEIQEVGVPDIDAVEAKYTYLNRRYKYKLKLKEDLRKRFRNEYLGQLKLFSEKKLIKEIKVGDIVLIENQNMKRADWPLAYVTECINGRDGKIRLVKLKTSNGCLLRPLQRIYSLELNHNDEENERKGVKFKTINRKIPKDRNNKFVENERKQEYITRSGRKVMKPVKYSN